MEQKKEVHDEEEPDTSGAEMVKSIARCAMAVGECLSQGYRVLVAVRDASRALKKRSGPDLKIVK